MTGRRPEVLAPVGNREMLEAAIAAGCDAVYMAAQKFGARAYAENFDEAAMQAAITLAHLNQVRVYITINTLIKNDEFDEALEQAKRLAALGCDALIIQDIGLIESVHAACPSLALHGSTQMSVTSLEGALTAQRLGLTRIVIGREVSIEEAERIVRETALEVELFVHGSLCVSVSGQCTMSSFAGGRSGNRGRCAQPCRKRYDLINAEGKVFCYDETLLSPRDLSTIDEVNAYLRAGITSMKIEGRMKKPEYVYATVLAYRRAIEGLSYDADAMHLMTNRPFTRGFLHHDFGMDYGFSARLQSGLVIGRVTRRGGIRLCSNRALWRGDIIRLRGDRGAFTLTLTQDYAIGEPVDLSGYPDLHEGDPVYLIYTARVRGELNRAKAQVFGRPEVELSCFFSVGEAMVMTAASRGHTVCVSGDVVTAARSKPMDEGDIRRAIGRLGDTAFELSGLHIELAPGSFVPMGRIKQLRRSALKALESALLSAHREAVRLETEEAYRQKADAPRQDGSVEPSRDETLAFETMRVLALETDRAPEAFAEADRVSRVYLTGIDREAFTSPGKRAAKLISAWHSHDAEVYVGLPRLLEHDAFDAWAQALMPHVDRIDGWYARSLNDIAFFRRMAELMQSADQLSKPVVWGHELNCTNDRAISVAKALGASTVCYDIELTGAEQSALKASLPMQLQVYGRYAAMLLKHCPAAMIKGCRDDSGCMHCAFRRGIFLKDDFGSREVIRRGGSSEVLLPELVDYRLVKDAVDRIMPTVINIIDHGEPDVNSALADWASYLETGKFVSGQSLLTKRVKIGGREMLRTTGHLFKGIE